MIGLTHITGFQWDAGNARKSMEKHGVSQGEAEQIFFNDPFLLLINDKHSLHEPRFHALGHTGDGRKLYVTFALRDQDRLIRVISARDLHQTARMRHEQDA